MHVLDKYELGWIKPSKGRLSSKGTFFEDFKRPFIVIAVHGPINPKSTYCTLEIQDLNGDVFEVWSDSMEPNVASGKSKSSGNFKIHW